MSAEDKVREAEAILAAIESGKPLRSCKRLSFEFHKAIKLLEEAGCIERCQELQWDRAVCFLPAHLSIAYPSDSKERFYEFEPFPPEALNYFAGRAAQVTNPLLKARYNDFLWEKSSSADKRKYAEAAIDAYLQSARQLAELTESFDPLAMIDALDRATNLSIQLNRRDKVAAIVTLLVDLLEHLREVNPAEQRGSARFLIGRWTIEPARILLHIRQQQRFSNLVDQNMLTRVQQMTEELAATHAAANNHLLERRFLEVATQAASLRNDAEAVYGLQLRYGESLEREAQARATGADASHLAAASIYEQALAHYNELRKRMVVEHRPELERRMNALKLKIREMYRAGRSEVGYIPIPVEIPRDEFEQLMAYLLEPATIDECLERVTSEGSLLPNVTVVEEQVKQAGDIAPLFAWLPKSVLSDDMSVATLTSEEERSQFLVDYFLMMQIDINSRFVLSELFDRLSHQKGLNAESLFRHLDGWGWIDEDNLEIIRSGLERYFAQDYVSALHILAPQFEDVLRTFFEKVGAPVIRLRRGERGWQFEPFGAFLDRDFVKQAMPLELRKYIRLVMADPKGWDLRNRVAHGLIHPQQCTKPVVDTVLHLFLLLTRFYIREESQTQSKEGG